ncbi:MAG: caspase family protein [Alphaproteobacteria bacterium]|nr:caspase family protein [Alphaproteobacteria bacterium]
MISHFVLQLMLSGAAVCMMVLAPASAWAEKRVALVIGDSACQNIPELTDPGRDGEAVAGVLKDAGFHSVDRNVGNRDFRLVIRKFEAAAAPADIGAIYYTGHGLEIDRTNSLIATNAPLAGDNDAEGTAAPFTAVPKNLPVPGLDIRLGRVRDEVMKETGNHQEPSVYGSPGGTKAALVSVAAPAQLSEVKGNFARVHKIARGLLWEVFQNTHPKGFHADRAGARFEAVDHGQEALLQEASLSTGPRTSEPSEDQLEWEKLRDVTDISVLRKFIRRFPDSSFVLSAQQRIEELRKADREREEQVREAERQVAEEARQNALQQKAEAAARKQREQEEQRAEAARKRVEAIVQKEAACRDEQSMLDTILGRGSEGGVEDLKALAARVSCQRLRPVVAAALERFTAEVALRKAEEMEAQAAAQTARDEEARRAAAAEAVRRAREAEAERKAEEERQKAAQEKLAAEAAREAVCQDEQMQLDTILARDSDASAIDELKAFAARVQCQSLLAVVATRIDRLSVLAAKRQAEQEQARKAEEERQAAKAERERLAAQAAAQKQAQAEAARKAEEERQAAKAERERLAAQAAAEKQAQAEAARKAEEERQAAAKAERERLAAQAAAEKQAQAEAARKAEEERQAAAKAERERLAAQAAAEKQAQAEAARKAEEERQAAAKAERERLAAQAAAEKQAQAEEAARKQAEIAAARENVCMDEQARFEAILARGSDGQGVDELRLFSGSVTCERLRLPVVASLKRLEGEAARRKIAQEKEQALAQKKRDEEAKRNAALEAERKVADAEAARKAEEELQKVAKLEEETRAAQARREAQERKDAESAAAKEAACREEQTRSDAILAMADAGERVRELKAFARSASCERLRPNVLASLEQHTTEAERRAEALPNSLRLVKAAQAELIRLGCFVGRPDGSLLSTQDAINRYLSVSGGSSTGNSAVTAELVKNLSADHIHSCAPTCNGAACIAGDKPKAGEGESVVSREHHDNSRARHARHHNEARRSKPENRRLHRESARPSPATGRSHSVSNIMGVGF